MKFLCLSLFLCSVTSAFAAVCDVQDQPDERLLGPHKTIETVQGTLMVAGIPVIPDAVRTETARLLNATDLAAPDLERAMITQATEQKALLERETNLRDYLYFALTENSYQFIMRDQTPELFMKEQAEASALYQNDFAQGLRSGVPANVREQILLLNMGPLNLLRLQRPELFASVTISVFDTTPVFAAAASEAAKPAEPVSDANPDAIAAQFRRQFARNPKTLADFNAFVRGFSLQKYRGFSDAQIRQRAQREVFAQAKPLIGRWVTAKLASLRAPAAPAATVNSEEVRKKEFDLGQALLNHNGTGIYLVEESAVAAITTALANACKRQP